MKYHAEIIDLPSKGNFYPDEHPLRSGQIEVKYMTAKEEDILTSSNLIKKNKVLDKLLESIIVTPNVSHLDILAGDINAILVAARIMSYGKDYIVSIKCPKCELEQEFNIDLSELDTKEPGATELKLELPISKDVLELKAMTRRVELDIEGELKAMKGVGVSVEPEVTTTMKNLIRSVNGNTDKSLIKEYSENILIKDLEAVRTFYKMAIGDINFQTQFSCSNSECEHQTVLPFEVGLGFFWPNARV
jgi:hypothetical protein